MKNISASICFPPNDFANVDLPLPGFKGALLEGIVPLEGSLFLLNYS
jgi:hypothetical protein